MSLTNLAPVGDPDSPLYMGGTEQTGQYVVLATSPRGRVGLRALASGAVRIRLEPSEGTRLGDILQSRGGWKQPGDGGQNRYSILLLPADFDNIGEAAIWFLEKCLKGLRRGNNRCRFNPALGTSKTWQQRLLKELQTA